MKNVVRTRPAAYDIYGGLVRVNSLLAAQLPGDHVRPRDLAGTRRPVGTLARAQEHGIEQRRVLNDTLPKASVLESIC